MRTSNWTGFQTFEIFLLAETINVTISSFSICKTFYYSTLLYSTKTLAFYALIVNLTAFYAVWIVMRQSRLAAERP